MTRLVWLVSLCISLFAPSLALACAPVPPPGYQIKIEKEQAIIIWDQKRGVEHFIRRASFETGAMNFGFLVPTPTVPELAEVPDVVFQELHALTKPKRKVQKKVKLQWGMWLFGRGELKAVPRSAVKVLVRKKIAGYNAVVLEATDAKAMADWINKNGYMLNPELQTWLAPYIKMGWKITAFKIENKEAAQAPSTSAVRMSFKTKRPFYPYREPASMQKVSGKTPRSLRVYVLSETRMKGTLGDGKKPWPAVEGYSNEVDGQVWKKLSLLPKKWSSSLGALWLTTFVDRSSPRPGVAEVFFSSVKNVVKAPPPIINIKYTVVTIPMELFALLLLFVGLWFVGRRLIGRNRAR